jgi:hypothetical protein
VIPRTTLKPIGVWYSYSHTLEDDENAFAAWAMATFAFQSQFDPPESTAAPETVIEDLKESSGGGQDPTNDVVHELAK